MAIAYFGGSNEVQLGDRVAISIWFKRRSGRVVYIPGVSALNSEFEYNGMRWVGIRLEDRGLVATPVLSKTQGLKKKVKFIERDNSFCELITADSREFEKSGEGPAL
jgi:hypothetical protein